MTGAELASVDLDAHELEPSCVGCNVSTVDLDSHYIAPCAVFCESCLELHLGQCGACLAEFAGEFVYVDEPAADALPIALQSIPAAQLSLF